MIKFLAQGRALALALVFLVVSVGYAQSGDVAKANEDLSRAVHVISESPIEELGAKIAAMALSPNLEPIDVFIQEEDLREVEELLRHPEAMIVRRPRVVDWETGQIGIQVRRSRNIFDIAAEIIHRKAVNARMARDMGIPGRIFIEYADGRKVPFAQARVSDGARYVFTQLLRLVTFEEVFHELEAHLNTRTGLFYDARVNSWLSKSGLTAKDILGVAGREASAKSSGLHANYLRKMSDLTVFLALEKNFPEWMLSPDLRTHIIESSPETRSSESPLFRAIACGGALL